MQWTAPHPRRHPYPAEIQEGKRKIEELNPQIANLTNQIEELNKLRLLLEQERQNCQSFIAPFNRMPTEILCEIACHAVHQETSPLLLNQICAPMRDAVNGFKALWNHIYIRGRWSSPEPNKTEITCNNKQWLQVLLERASPASLFIRIGEDAFNGSMLEPLIQFSPYINTIDIDEAAGSYTKPLIQLSAMNFCGLQYFSYGTTNEVPTALINTLDAINRSCHHKLTLRLHLRPIAFYPALAHPVLGNVFKLILVTDKIRSPLQSRDVFRLGAMPYFQSLEAIGVPYLFKASDISSLTHLHLRARGEWERIDIEDIPMGIRSLELHRYNILQRHEDSVSVHRFSNLKNIDFIESIIKVTGGCILAPRLKYLAVGYCDFNHSNVFSTHLGDHFVNGAPFGSHSLRQLRVRQLTITGSCLQKMKSFSTCRHLGLQYCRLSDDFIMGLCCSPESPDALFPILEELSVHQLTTERGHFLPGLFEECAVTRPSLKIEEW